MNLEFLEMIDGESNTSKWSSVTSLSRHGTGGHMVKVSEAANLR